MYPPQINFANKSCWALSNELSFHFLYLVAENTTMWYEMHIPTYIQKLMGLRDFGLFYRVWNSRSESSRVDTINFIKLSIIIFLIKLFPQSIYAVRVDSPYVFFRYRHRQRDWFASILLIKFENECFNVNGLIREIQKSIQSNIFLKIIACIRKYYREIYPLLFFQYHSETIHIWSVLVL